MPKCERALSFFASHGMLIVHNIVDPGTAKQPTFSVMLVPAMYHCTLKCIGSSSPTNPLHATPVSLSKCFMTCDCFSGIFIKYIATAPESKQILARVAIRSSKRGRLGEGRIIRTAEGGRKRRRNRYWCNKRRQSVGFELILLRYG